MWVAISGLRDVESHYICFRRRLHPEQKGSVSTDKESDMFEMNEGTKQGDPLSSLGGFNTVLQKALKDDVERWQKSKRHQFTKQGDNESDCLAASLRHDVLLFSTSLVQLQKMMCDFKQSTESVGLKIHPDKTKILSNSVYKQKKRRGHQPALKLRYFAGVGECEISWAKKNISATKETAEIKNRIRAAWPGHRSTGTNKS